ncbi:MAG TPA: hypothetical protein VFW44_11060 [Bryobacteraceae bacterium]|nr:hypothetical protein [Bryobacteraceae bacterium]
MSLLLLALALIAERRGFVAQDVVWFGVSRVGSTVPAHPFDLPSMLLADEGRNVAVYDPLFVHSHFDRYWSDTTYELHISRGRMQLQKVEDYLKPAALWDSRPVQWDVATHSMGLRKLEPVPLVAGVTYIHGLSSADRMVMHTPLEDFPLWPILIATAILPSTWLVKSFRRPKRGHCPECSYNLTGNTSGVCPECGGRISN